MLYYRHWLKIISDSTINSIGVNDGQTTATIGKPTKG
jgi:hypothetical protein